MDKPRGSQNLAMLAGVRGELPLTCCSVPRHSVVKRWTMGQFFFSIERCRRCLKWWRRKSWLKEINGKMIDGTEITYLNEKINSTQKTIDAL